MASKNIVVFCISFLTNLTLNNSADPSICAIQESCATCLAADFACAWCTDQNYPSTRPRCMTNSDLKGTCNEGSIQANIQEVIILQDKKLQDYQKNQETIQIRPQKAKIRLVKGHTAELRMTYRPARNGLLDLYYLMDLTFSMEDDRKTLVSVANKLTEALGLLSENHRLGFGSFSDKPAMPMIMPGTKENPCKPAGIVCEPAYDFRHRMSLTNDTTNFMQRVDESRVTGNLDNLEGTLDALMQVIVCTDQIGWSEDARKIVIVATDSLMHFAGDGLLAGLVKPNDKKCHLDKSGLYEAALEFDYPSLEEIYRELLRRKINVIFAATKSVAETYWEMTSLMREVSSVQILTEDSSNIVDLVHEGYRKFIRKVNFVDTSSSNIDVSYKTDCGLAGSEMRLGNTCNNLDIGQEVNFAIGFTAKDFPKDGVYNHVIRIEETGLSEYLEVEVEIQKPCPCEQSNKTIPIGRELCNFHGNFECGMCFCDVGWIGRTCSCNSQTGSTTELINQCRKPLADSLLGPICSGLGECDCGQCYCFSGFEGQFCECPTCGDACNPKTAECKCGKCECRSGWSGPECDCALSKDSCLSPNDEICSGQGECKCGKCECNAMFHGSLCEVNQNATEFENKICQYFNPCVDNLLRERRGEKVNVAEVCMDENRMPFSYSFEYADKESFQVCNARVQFEDEMSCDYRFIYDTNKNAKQLYVEWYECEPVNFAAIISGSVLATILLGLTMMCVVKVFFVYQDRQEFARFEKQTQSAQWQTTMSPIYERPIRECKMPEDMEGTELN